MTSGDLYDTLEGPHLDEKRWVVLAVPLPGGDLWHYAEPAAVIEVCAGTVTLDVAEFTRSHPAVQMLDNPKHLVVSVESIAIPPDGTLTISAEMAAENRGGNPADFRDGFAAFNVLDMESGMVFDHGATSLRSFSIYERLAVPGAEDTWTYFVESPLAAPIGRPGEFHDYGVTLDAARRVAIWTVDGRTVFEAPEVPVVPKAVRVGFGLITLHPIVEGRSVSLRGQGLRASWRRFRVESSLRR
jgi:hypothetical protein